MQVFFVSSAVETAETLFYQMLKHLRQLWDEELYCDVVLKVGDKLIKSHRVVLCAGSR